MKQAPQHNTALMVAALGWLAVAVYLFLQGNTVGGVAGLVAAAIPAAASVYLLRRRNDG